MLCQTVSESIYERLCQVIVAGVNSPVRAFTGLQMLPMVVERGVGDCVIDADGRSYVDYCCSWGALIHGHAHPAIVESVVQRIAQGTSFGITSEIEEKLARVIVESVDSVDLLRFCCSGTEAAMTAVRIARGFTGKEFIVKFAGNYHGHADPFLVEAGSGALALSQASSAGVPSSLVQRTLCLPYNDCAALDQLFERTEFKDNIAAVIVEPIAANMGVVPAEESFLQKLREETEKRGILLIFDEVVSGFRLELTGAQGIYQIQPDLSCFGKVIGGGFPSAAVGGRRELMECLAPLGSVYQAGTLSGNPVAIEAGLKTVELLKGSAVYHELKRKTDVITQPVRRFLKEQGLKACLQQVESMFTLFFGKSKVSNLGDAKELDGQQFVRFFRFMYENGIYIPPSPYEAWFVSTVHEESHLEKTRDLILSFLKQLV